MSARSIKIRITVGHEDAASAAGKRAPVARPLPTQSAANTLHRDPRRPIIYAVSALLLGAAALAVFWSGDEPVPTAPSIAQQPSAEQPTHAVSVPTPAAVAPVAVSNPTPAVAVKASSAAPAPTRATAQIAPNPGTATPTSGTLVPAAPAQATPRAAAVPAKATTAETRPATLGHDPIARAVLARGVAKREPVDQLGNTVAASPVETSLFFFTEIRGMKGRTVRHRWLHNGTPVATVPLKIGADTYRVYSSKTFRPAAKGAWQVLVLDESGATLRTFDFVYE